MDGRSIPVVIEGLPFRTGYGPRDRLVKDATAETHGTNVKQSFKDEVDVNNVVARFERTGVLPEPRGGEPLYLDVAEFPSYQEAMARVREVESFFAGLPAETREAFDNDAVAFADWAMDEKNLEAAKQLGVQPVETPVASSVDDGAGQEGSGGLEPS